MGLLTKQEALAKIAECLEIAQNAVWEAEGYADEYGLTFEMNLGTRGMGGWYDPADVGTQEEDWMPPSDGWSASSQSC